MGKHSKPRLRPDIDFSDGVVPTTSNVPDLQRIFSEYISELESPDLDRAIGRISYGLESPDFARATGKISSKDLRRRFPEYISDLDPLQFVELFTALDPKRLRRLIDNRLAAPGMLDRFLGRKGQSTPEPSTRYDAISMTDAFIDAGRISLNRVADVERADFIEPSIGTTFRQYQRIFVKQVDIERAAIDLIHALDDEDDAVAEKIAAGPNFGLPMVRSLLKYARASDSEREAMNELLRCVEDKVAAMVARNKERTQKAVATRKQNAVGPLILAWFNRKQMTGAKIMAPALVTEASEEFEVSKSYVRGMRTQFLRELKGGTCN
jgi:hypothetical protein